MESNVLQDHKANEIHDFAVHNDSQVPQMTWQENGPARTIEEIRSKARQENKPAREIVEKRNYIKSN